MQMDVEVELEDSCDDFYVFIPRMVFSILVGTIKSNLTTKSADIEIQHSKMKRGTACWRQPF